MSIALRCTNRSFARSFARALATSVTLNVKELTRVEPIKRVGQHVYRNVTYYEVWLHDRHLVRAIQDWTGPTTTHEWKIDLGDARQRGPAYCDGLIQGLYDSDGSISRNGARGVSIRFGTASAAGAKSLHALMTWRGFETTLAPVNGKGEHRISVRAASAMRYAIEISSRIHYKRMRLLNFVKRCAAG
jgi:hypothetical protein